MGIFKRIGDKTPKKNKTIGIVTTVLAGTSLTIAESGLLDHKPLIKIALEILSAKLGAIAVYNAQKVETDGENK